jgi:septal ring factor EnvC (AmiA/AmiB activator)
MENLSNRQNRYWVALASVVVLAVAGFAILNNQHQQRLQAEVQAQAQAQAQAQDQANRDVMERMQGELALKNELESASQREAALQLQLKEMDAGASRLQAADGQQEARRQQAERELQDLRTQRAKLEKQVDCQRIQLTVNQLGAKGDTDQALKLKSLWTVPCPNLQAAG